MAWTEFSRAQHRRKTKRYPSDLTNAEWEIVRPLLPCRILAPGLREAALTDRHRAKGSLRLALCATGRGGFCAKRAGPFGAMRESW
jgi:transposase